MNNLKKWTRPDNYIGPNHCGYYVGPGQNRDSDALTRSNFHVALELLGGESTEQVELVPGSDESDHVYPVQVIRDSHWACGWIEYILVHESAADKVAILANITERIDQYPVLDDSHWSETEWNDGTEIIENHVSEFRREILKFIGFKNTDISLRPARERELDAFVDYIYRDSVGYCGAESAWVNDGDIARVAESQYPDAWLKRNTFYRLCRAALGLKQVA